MQGAASQGAAPQDSAAPWRDRTHRERQGPRRRM